MKRLGRWAAGLLAVLVLLTGLAWWASAPPAPDAFYDAAPRPEDAPGTLLREEAFTRLVPPGASALRILYRTSHANGTPAVASALVVYKPGAASGPRDMLAWAHGTTGFVRGCAPSLMAKPFANIPAFPALLDEGWLFVATDYAGLGTAGPHIYLKGDEAARAVLDAARAVRGLTALQASPNIVVWGHSQGGNTALWTGIIAPQYAPDLSLKGVAALAPASDLNGLFTASRAGMFGRIVSSYLIESAAAAGLVRRDDYLSGWRSLISADLASRCVGEWGTLFSAAETALLPAAGLFAGDPMEGSLGGHLTASTPARPVPASLLIAQGTTDDLVLPAVQDAFVQDRRAAGQMLDYRTYANRDHIGVVAPDSPLGADLLTWTRERFQN